MIVIVSEPQVKYEVQRWSTRYKGPVEDYISGIEDETVITFLPDRFIYKTLSEKPKRKLSALGGKISKKSSKVVDSQIPDLHSEWERRYIFEINGEILRVPMNLKHIADSIEEGKEILQYEDDWDNEGAVATDSNTFLKAAKFVIQYSVHIYKDSSVILTTPYMDILRDGSVSVYWESAKSNQLLVIFNKRKDEPAVFYAEQGDRKIPLKGAIIPDEAIDESLAIWMKNYLYL